MADSHQTTKVSKIEYFIEKLILIEVESRPLPGLRLVMTMNL